MQLSHAKARRREEKANPKIFNNCKFKLFKGFGCVVAALREKKKSHPETHLTQRRSDAT